MDSREYKVAYRGAALSIFVHMAALFAGFSILAAVFDFPEVLRQTSEARLQLFRENQAIAQPVYWVLAMTGFSQMAIAGFLYRSFREREKSLLQFMLLFGTLAGLLQTLGFIRWAILIPYLAEQMGAPEVTPAARETIALLEGAFNRYAGMAIGEHIGNLCLGMWTILLSIAILRSPLLDRRLGKVGIPIGILAMALGLEQFGIAPDVFGAVVDFGFPAWAVWLIVVGTSLWRTNGEIGNGPVLGWKTLLWSGGVYLLMVLPTVLGG